MAMKTKKMLVWAVVLAGVYFFWDKISATIGGVVHSIKSKTGGTSTTTNP